MQKARIRGTEIAYSLHGSMGDPVLLIMGYTMPGRVWIHQWPTLAQRHRVALYDHRGVGESAPTTGPLTMAELAADALGLLDHLGWTRAHVIGASMGGMVAQHLALAAPERTLSLGLIATHAGGLRHALPTARGLARLLSAHLGPRAHRLATVERLLFPDAFIARCDRAWLRDVIAHDFADPVPAATRRHQLAAILRHDTRERLGELAAKPVLIVRPGLDLLVRPSGSDALQRLLPRAQMARCDHAGHGVIRQCKERVNAAILELIGG